MDKRVAKPYERIKELTKEFDISQADICKKTGLSSAVVSMYATGKRTPKQDKLALIAQAYNVDPTWLMGYDVPMRRTEILKGIDTDIIMDYILNNDIHLLVESYKTLSVEKKEHLLKYADLLSKGLI